MNEEIPNPYQPAEHTERDTSLPNLFPLGVSLLGASLLYIFLMLTNIAVYLPRVLEDSDDRSHSMIMLIYVAIIIAYNAFLIIGAASIIQRRRYTLAFLSCCFAIVPMLGPCLFLGVPIGVWGLILLTKQNVRASFASHNKRNNQVN